MSDPFTKAIREAVRAEIHALTEVLGSRGTTPRIAGNVDEFGYAWGMSGAKVRELVKRGLPHVKIGAQTRIMFHDPEVLAWLRANGDYLAGGDDQ